jgi:hypothetical protein
MSSNLSWRHHYIPQFYLKGFVNRNKTLAIYDKKADLIKGGEYSTKTHFFEKDRNTLLLNGEKNDFIETILYKQIDDDISNLFKNIINKDLNFLTPENLFTLKMFISFLYWRIPANDKLINHFIDNYDFNELGFKIINKETKESANQELIEKFKTNPAFRRMYSFILPYSTFKMNYLEEDENRWKSIANDNEGLQLTCDNPVITLLKDRFYEKDQKLIFPVTSQKMVFYGQTSKSGKLPREFYLQADLAMFHVADRYVCGPDKSYLEDLLELYRIQKDFDKTDRIIPDLFKFLE